MFLYINNHIYVSVPYVFVYVSHLSNFRQLYSSLAPQFYIYIYIYIYIYMYIHLIK